jgi:hypothetical protein
MPARSTAIKRQAEEAIRPMLEPGERTRAGVAVACGPTRWGFVWVAAVVLALIAEGLAGIFGPESNLLSGSLPAAVGVAFPLLAIVMAPRPMYIAVSDQRLIGLRLSRFGGAPGRLAFAAPLGDVRVTRQRSPGSVRCEIRGRKRTRLNAERPWHRDFAELTTALRYSGVLTEPDPS